MDIKIERHEWKESNNPRRHIVERYASALRTTDGHRYVSRWVSLCRKSAFHLAMTLTLDFWPWKPFFSNCAFDEYMWQVSLKSLHGYRDIASREIGVTDNGRSDGMPENTMPLVAYCWRRKHNRNGRAKVIRKTVIAYLHVRWSCRRLDSRSVYYHVTSSGKMFTHIQCESKK